MNISTLAAAGQPVIPRHYGRTRTSRLKAYARPVIAVALVAGMLYAIRGNTPGGWSIIGLALLIISTGTWAIYGVLNASHESFTIGPDWLEYTTYTSNRVYSQEEIDSYETVSDNLIFIHFKNPDNTYISFDNGIAGAEEIKQWLAARVSDRKQTRKAKATAQEQAARQEVLATPALGATAPERTWALKRLRRMTAVLNLAGALCFFCIWLPPETSSWAYLAGLLLPLLVIAALWRYPTVLRLDGDKQNGHPGVASAFAFASAGLLLKYLSTNKISYAPLWPLAGAAALATAGMLVFGSRHFLWRPKPAIGLGLLILPLAAMYGFSAIGIVNQQYDAGATRHFTVRVLERQESKSRYHHSYYLTTEPWSDAPGTTKPEVSYSVYARTEQDSLVHVALHPGLLGAAWYEVLNE